MKLSRPPGGSEDKTSAYNVGDSGSIPGRKSSWRRKWQPALVSLPGKPHGQRSLVGYSPWGRKELDTTEQPHFNEVIRVSCSSAEAIPLYPCSNPKQLERDSTKSLNKFGKFLLPCLYIYIYVYIYTRKKKSIYIYGLPWWLRW